MTFVPTVSLALNGKAGNRDDGETQDPIVGDNFTPALGETSIGMGVCIPIDLRNGSRTDGMAGVGTPGTGVGHNGDPSYGVCGVTQAVATSASVRRLTPLECCRLQGLPDWWFDGVPGTSDSKMYAGLGDAVTATVAEWIGRRIVAADAMAEERAA